MRGRELSVTLSTKPFRDLGEDLSADFTAEVQMLAALRHPNVCLFMGACVAPPNRAIITELVSRGSLWEALRDENLPLVRFTFCCISFGCLKTTVRSTLRYRTVSLRPVHDSGYSGRLVDLSTPVRRLSYQILSVHRVTCAPLGSH